MLIVAQHPFMQTAEPLVNLAELVRSARNSRLLEKSKGHGGN